MKNQNPNAAPQSVGLWMFYQAFKIASYIAILTFKFFAFIASGSISIIREFNEQRKSLPNEFLDNSVALDTKVPPVAVLHEVLPNGVVLRRYDDSVSILHRINGVLRTVEKLDISLKDNIQYQLLKNRCLTEQSGHEALSLVVSTELQQMYKAA